MRNVPLWLWAWLGFTVLGLLLRFTRMFQNIIVRARWDLPGRGPSLFVEDDEVERFPYIDPQRRR